MPYADNSGVKIWWEDVGSGDPLVLLMGFGHSGQLWRPVADKLAEHHRLLIIDNRGTGQSDSPPGAYTVPLMATDTIAVLDAAGVATASIFGVSLGAVIAQEVALMAPERASSLVLGCAACPRHNLDASKLALATLLFAGFLPRRLTGSMMRRYSYAATTPQDVVDSLAPLKQAAAAPRRTVVHLARAGAYETCSRAPTISAPTLILHGTEDRLAPIANARRLAELIPRSRLVELEGRGHSFFLEDVDRTVDEVRQHLG
jgi:3-oxoadipate enol-lactonase